ncbi:MAG: NAD-dependent epimerase/dehydratase family protein [Clostridiales bacterium]|nr:NAD-dependent epimerase/dehydratase family protein [Clostridiales bacterium]
MKRILVTGGTVFVSKFTAQYFVYKGYDVYVINRNTRPQVKGVTLIEADRHTIGDKLKGIHFDAVLDVTAYDASDVLELIKALDSFDDYVMISSSAVYPETSSMPIKEDSPLGENKFWGPYGTGKLEAEEVLRRLVPEAYILRPPYIYGPMNSVYREAFVFDCAMNDRKFYLPRDGSMKLQFFHVGDLCETMEKIIENRPSEHIYNVGNKESISVRDWVTLCYECAGKTPEFVEVHKDIEQRKYFSFYDYEYSLDVSRQELLLPSTFSIKDGLSDCYLWYKDNQGDVKKKPYIEYIDSHLSSLHQL